MPHLPDGLRLVDVPAERHHEWLNVFLGAFNEAPGDDEPLLRILADDFPHTDMIAIDDDQGYVATAGAPIRPLVVPGGATIDMSGVTGVAVDATARRRGLLRSMMDHLHRRAVDQGCVVAGLGASEWPIYGRFGYGVAAWTSATTVTTRGAGWRHDAPGADLSFHRLPTDQVATVARDLHAATVRTTPGEVVRPDSHFDRFAQDPVSLRGGASERRTLWIPDRGLAMYRISSSWTDDTTPDFTVSIRDVFATDTEALAALWRGLVSIDLVTTASAGRQPTDSPLNWWVTDARHVAARRSDALWLKPLDVPGMLTARSWQGSGALTLRCHDADGYAEGTWRLEVDDGQATCTATDAEPDLELHADALGAIYLGGTAATELTAAGRIRATDHAAAVRWDALATPERAPWTSIEF